MEFDAYLHPRPRANWLLWIIVTILAIPAAWLSYQSWEAYQRIERQQARNARLAARTSTVVVPKPSRSDQDIAKQWGDLKMERDFPWQRIFQVVENADKADIELLGFQPDKRNRRILLRGQALNAQALVSYLDALADQPAVSQVYLVHQQAVSKDKLETISFEIKATIR